MRVQKIDGIGTLTGGEYDRVEVDGIAKLAGDLTVGIFEVDGVIKGSGTIHAKKFECDGVATLTGDISAESIHIDGTVKLSGGKVEAESFRCDGCMTAEGEICADQVIVDGIIKAAEIYGDEVRICSKGKGGIFPIPNLDIDIMGIVKIKNTGNKHGSFTVSSVKTIEATTVEIKYTKAELVSGQFVTIGPGCVVKRVDCDEKLVIAETAVVEEIVGDASVERAAN